MWWFLTTAGAHVGDVVGGIDLVVDPHGAEIEASYGLVIPAGDDWRWICHEAVTETGVLRSPRYARSPDGGWLAWIPDPALGRGGETLFRSTDGCDWPAVTGLGVVTSAAFDPADGTSALATSGTPGAANAIWASSDGGATFVPAFPPLPDRRFGSVAHGPDESWATATDDAGLRLFLWHRPADGVWVEHELPASAAPAELRVLTPGAPGVVWLLLDPFGADTVLEAHADGTSAVALARNVTITDAAWDGSRLWLVQDGVFLLSLDGAEITEHPAFPLSIGITVTDGVLWAAPQSYLADALLSRSTDGGETFETLAHPDDIAAPLSCPAGSRMATVCEPLWDQLLPRIRGYDTPPVDTGTEPEPEIPPHVDPETPPVEAEAGTGCGCDGSGGAGGLLPGLLLLGLRGRSGRSGSGSRARSPRIPPGA